MIKKKNVKTPSILIVIGIKTISKNVMEDIKKAVI